MKNKETEELLNDMRHSYEIHEDIIKKYNNADKISYPYTINLKQIYLLLSYIEQLEDKINWYENIDINKTIDNFRVEHNEEIKELHNKIEQLENNRDKAIERIQYEEMFDNDNNHLINFKEELKYILLKGDSE